MQASDSVAQKKNEIKEQKVVIAEIRKEWSGYLEVVRVASSQIHQLAGAALDPATPVTASDLKKALVEIHGGIAALQQLTGEACLSLQKKGTYPYNAESDSTHDVDSVDDLGGVSSIALCCSPCQCEQYMLYLFKYLYMSRVVYYICSVPGAQRCVPTCML